MRVASSVALALCWLSLLCGAGSILLWPALSEPLVSLGWPIAHPVPLAAAVLAVFPPALAPLLRRDAEGAHAVRQDRYGLVVAGPPRRQDSDVEDRIRRSLAGLDALDLSLDQVVEAQARLKLADEADPQRATDLERLTSFREAVCVTGPALQAMLQRWAAFAGVTDDGLSEEGR